MNRLRLLLLLACTLIVLYYGCQWLWYVGEGKDQQDTSESASSFSSSVLYLSPNHNLVVFEQVDLLSGVRSRVLERCISRSLDSHTVESCMDVRHPEKLRLAYVRMLFGALYLFNSIQDCENVLLIGLGAGSFATSLNHLARGRSQGEHASWNLQVDIVEVDKEVVRIAREWFGYKEGPGTKVRIEDGATYVSRSPAAAYNLIVVDAYDASGHVPVSIASREFVAGMKRALRPGGVAAVNLYNITDGAMQGWLKQEFEFKNGHNHVFELKDGNSVVLAVKGTGERVPARAISMDLIRKRAHRLEPQFDSINIDTEWLLEKFAKSLE